MSMPFAQFALAAATLIAPVAIALHRKLHYWWAIGLAASACAAIIFTLDPQKHADDWLYTAVFPAFLCMWAMMFDGGQSGRAAGAPDRLKLVRSFVKKRVIQDPIASLHGYSPEMVDQLPPAVLLGLPEATLVLIVESFAALRKLGASESEALKRIEAHRSAVAPGRMPASASLEQYVAYRLSLEHSGGGPISHEHIADCVLLARTLYRC